MNNWIPKNKIIRFAVTVVSFSVILYLIGLFVVFMEIEKVENLYNDTESEFSKSKKVWAIKSIAEANGEIIETLRRFLIQKGDEIEFIEQIEQVAEDSGINFDITSIGIKANQTDPFKENIDVMMDLEGSWENVLFFVDKLEKMPFGVSIKDIKLDARIPGEWSGLIKFIIFREK